MPISGDSELIRLANFYWKPLIPSTGIIVPILSSCWSSVISDMGCGKSVVMAFLVDELNWRNGFQLPHPKTCYYYCRDGETGNAISILSALILSLLDQLWGLKKPFSKWYKQAKASGIFNPARDINKLEEFLQISKGAGSDWSPCLSPKLRDHTQVSNWQ